MNPNFENPTRSTQATLLVRAFISFRHVVDWPPWVSGTRQWAVALFTCRGKLATSHCRWRAVGVLLCRTFARRKHTTPSVFPLIALGRLFSELGPALFTAKHRNGACSPIPNSAMGPATCSSALTPVWGADEEAEIGTKFMGRITP